MTMLDCQTPCKESTNIIESAPEHKITAGNDSFRSLIAEASLTNDEDVCVKALATIETLQQALAVSIANYNELFSKNNPSFYVQEFVRLTDRMHDLTMAKNAVNDRLHELGCSRCSKGMSNYACYSNNTNHSSIPEAIKVHFPNEFTTMVGVRKGLTLRQSLEKKFEIYKHCGGVFCHYQPENLTPIYAESKQKINWDILLSDLEETEIYLEDKQFPAHSYALIPNCRLIYRVLSLCCVCQKKLLFEPSYRCRFCRCEWHEKCRPVTETCCSRWVLSFQRRLNERHLTEDRLCLPSNLELCYKWELPAEEYSLSCPKLDPLFLPNKKKSNLSCNEGALSPHSISQPSSPRLSHKRFRDKNTKTRNADWEIDPSDIIRKNRKIGSGSFGTVFEAELINHGRVAIKELKVRNPGKAQLAEFKNEVVALKKCRHINIVFFLGYLSKPHLAIVTQWCIGSSLYHHLHVREKKWRIVTLMELARQICQGMCYLHAREIIHRDLKSNNIFLQLESDGEWLIKIGDMGLAAVKSVWTDEKPCRQPTGSILWMAPEVIRMESPDPYTYKSDVYSFGVVLYEIVSGKLPYSKIDNRDQILFLVGMGRLKPSSADARPDCPKLVKSYIENCCLYEVDKRPLFNELLNGFENLVQEMPRILRSQSLSDLPSLRSRKWSQDVTTDFV